MGTRTSDAPRMARRGHQISRVDGIDAFYQRKSQRTGLHHDAKKSCKAEASKKKSVKICRQVVPSYRLTLRT